MLKILMKYIITKCINNLIKNVCRAQKFIFHSPKSPSNDIWERGEGGGGAQKEVGGYFCNKSASQLVNIGVKNDL